MHSIHRVGGQYNESELNSQYNSAKSIRNALSAGNYDVNELKIPQYVLDNLITSTIDYNKLFAIISSKCLDTDHVYEDSEGILNRIKKYSQTAKSYNELVELVHTKRYTKSKIKRILLHIALKHNNSSLNKIDKPNILAIKKDRRHLLSLIDFSGEEKSIDQNNYADKIYNIVSSDKITNNTMLIL